MEYRKTKIKSNIRWRLLRNLIYSLAKSLNVLSCYRCGKEILLEDFSIEHTEQWKTEEEYLDISKISFSHLLCNKIHGASLSKELRSKKTHCPKGHEYSEENTYKYKNNRQCRKCRVIRVKNFRRVSPKLVKV